jgi:hypothetical protein
MFTECRAYKKHCKPRDDTKENKKTTAPGPREKRQPRAPGKKLKADRKQVPGRVLRQVAEKYQIAQQHVTLDHLTVVQIRQLLKGVPGIWQERKSSLIKRLKI